MNEKKALTQYLKENKGINTYYGFLTTETQIGEGGNSIVYRAKLNEIIVAVKFLINGGDRQKNRYKAECLNTIFNGKRLTNSAVYLFAGEFVFSNDQGNYNVDYIVMEYYKRSLKAELSHNKVTIDQLWKIYQDLRAAISSFEKCGIIHRDLKPENILIDETGNYIVADFGIAHFPEDSLIDGKTKVGERLANYCFSAPEQYVKNSKVGFSADLFAFGEILYWCVFDKTVRGEGGKHITEVFPDSEKARIIDTVIHLCIRDAANRRPKNIQELDYIIKRTFESNKPGNPFDDMEVLSNAVCEIVPEGYNHVYCLEDTDIIRDLIKSITSKKYNKKIWFNTGISNNEINDFKELKNGHYILNGQEFSRIKRCILSLSYKLYDDIIIFEVEHPDLYIIDGKQVDSVIHIEEPVKAIVSAYNADSGYVRIQNKVYKLDDLKCYKTYVTSNRNDRYYAVSPLYGCLQIVENDNLFREWQNDGSWDKTSIEEFKQKLKKSNKILDYL